MDKVPDQLRDKLGIAIGHQSYKAYRDILASDRWQRLANFGARPQRLLFASTGAVSFRAMPKLCPNGPTETAHGSSPNRIERTPMLRRKIDLST